MLFQVRIGCLAVISLCAASAQTSLQTRVATPDALTIARHKEGFSSAKALAKSGNVDQATAAVSALNRAKPGTASWGHTQGQLLLQLVEQLRAEGRTDLGAKVSEAALRHTLEAAKLATTDRMKAAAYAQAGHIQDRYLGDKAAALRSYELAAALQPEAKPLHERVSSIKRDLAAVPARTPKK